MGEFCFCCGQQVVGQSVVHLLGPTRQLSLSCCNTASEQESLCCLQSAMSKDLSQLSADEVALLLESVGLGRYAATFRCLPVTGAMLASESRRR